MRPQVNLPAEYIERLVSAIVAAVPTDTVYVFGSYARGEETDNSDIDIYIVTNDAAEKPVEYGKRVRLALPWINPWSAIGLAKDLDVVTSSTPVFRKRAGSRANLEYSVKRDDVRLYG